MKNEMDSPISDIALDLGVFAMDYELETGRSILTYTVEEQYLICA